MNSFEYLRKIGCHKRDHKYILDMISPEFYLMFDTEPCEDFPRPLGTVDMFVCKPGSSPKESEDRILLRSDCTEEQVLSIMDGLGLLPVSKFLA